jgi:hypothetical protein
LAAASRSAGNVAPCKRAEGPRDLFRDLPRGELLEPAQDVGGDARPQANKGIPDGAGAGHHHFDGGPERIHDPHRDRLGGVLHVAVSFPPHVGSLEDGRLLLLVAADDLHGHGPRVDAGPSDLIHAPPGKLVLEARLRTPGALLLFLGILDASFAAFFAADARSRAAFLSAAIRSRAAFLSASSRALRWAAFSPPGAAGVAVGDGEAVPRTPRSRSRCRSLSERMSSLRPVGRM